MPSGENQALTGEELEGSLDHAAWFQGRLYLFASAETMETFVSAPGQHTEKSDVKQESAAAAN